LPDFPDEAHLRIFKILRSVEKRYYDLIDIKKIIKIDSWFICVGFIDPIDPSFIQKSFKTRDTSLKNLGKIYLGKKRFRG